MRTAGVACESAQTSCSSCCGPMTQTSTAASNGNDADGGCTSSQSSIARHHCGRRQCSWWTQLWAGLLVGGVIVAAASATEWPQSDATIPGFSSTCTAEVGTFQKAN